MYPNGEIYSGNWSKDMKNGYGILEFLKKGKYEGNFVDDKFDGYGIWSLKSSN